MFNLSLPELVVIGAAALLVFGPRRLPELAKGLGKGIRDFRKALEGQEESEAEKGEAGKLPEGGSSIEVKGQSAVSSDEKPKKG